MFGKAAAESTTQKVGVGVGLGAKLQTPGFEVKFGGEVITGVKYGQGSVDQFAEAFAGFKSESGGSELNVSAYEYKAEESKDGTINITETGPKGEFKIKVGGLSTKDGNTFSGSITVGVVKYEITIDLDKFNEAYDEAFGS